MIKRAATSFPKGIGTSLGWAAYFLLLVPGNRREKCLHICGKKNTKETVYKYGINPFQLSYAPGVEREVSE